MNSAVVATKKDSAWARFKRKLFSNNFSPIFWINGKIWLEVQAAQSGKYQLDLEFDLSQQVTSMQADLLIVGGKVTYKQLPYLLDIYQKMPMPKWVVYWGDYQEKEKIDSYSIVPNIQEYLPIDLMIFGDVPEPRALTKSIFELKKKIKNGMAQAYLHPGNLHELE
ncbi:MAG: hypothetical protein ACOCUH_02815 [Bacteriovoracia bacterium]